jgi:MerR family redox-sensitive transcriptional activator SoxR
VRVAGIDHDTPSAFGQGRSECAAEALRGAGDKSNWRRCHAAIVIVEVNLKSNDRGASMRTTDLLTVGDVSERSGVAPSALRYYEAEGLIAAIRTTGNQRRYQRNVLRRLSFIRAAQNVGLSLSEITDALATLPNGRPPTRADWSRLSRSWRARLDEQIAALTKLRDGLDSCIGCGCLSLQRCAVQNPQDVLGSAGQGAMYLPRVLRATPPTRR